MAVTLTGETVVPTDRATRHLAQLCRHAGRMQDNRHIDRTSHGGGHTPPQLQVVECTENRGVLAFHDARCVIEATPDSLRLRVEAADVASLHRIQELVGQRLETIGSRERLKVSW